MKARRLAVEGATEFTPELFPDERGIFVSPFQGPAFSEACRGPVFPVAQVSLSVSKQGVVRGLHLTLTPPGMARYVHCPRGSALDIVADLRLGSATFGQTDSVILDQEAFRAVYLPVGVGHAFVALEDDTVVSYLLSKRYVPAHELTVSVFDPSLRLPVPAGIGPVMSARDREAPTLAQVRASGLLPEYTVCREIERALLESP